MTATYAEQVEPTVILPPVNRKRKSYRWVEEGFSRSHRFLRLSTRPTPEDYIRLLLIIWNKIFNPISKNLMKERCETFLSYAILTATIPA